MPPLHPKRRRPSSAMHPDSMLHLELKGVDLKNAAIGRLIHRVSSPIFIVSAPDGQPVATSARVPRTLNPSWPRVVIQCHALCCCDFDQPVKIEVFDQDAEGQNIASMGSFQATVRSILKRLAGRFTLHHEDGTIAGKIEIVSAMVEIVSSMEHCIRLEPEPARRRSLNPRQPDADHIPEVPQDEEARLRLVLKGNELVPIPGKVAEDLEDVKPNRFFRVTRFQPGRDRAFGEVYTSEVVPETSDPLWNEATVSLEDLCDGNRHIPILISVWEEPCDDHGVLDMGSCQTTVGELLRTTRRRPKTLTLMLPHSNRAMGSLTVVEANIVGNRVNPARWLSRNTRTLVANFRKRAQMRAQHGGNSVDTDRNKKREDDESSSSTLPELSESKEEHSISDSNCETTHSISYSKSKRESTHSISYPKSETTRQGVSDCASSRSDKSSSLGSDAKSSARRGGQDTSADNPNVPENSLAVDELHFEPLDMCSGSRVESILQNMPSWRLDGDDASCDDDVGLVCTNYGKQRGHSSIPNQSRPTKQRMFPKQHMLRKDRTPDAESANFNQSHGVPKPRIEGLPKSFQRANAGEGKKKTARSTRYRSQGRRHRHISSIKEVRRTRSRFKAAQGDEPFRDKSQACRNLTRTLHHFREIVQPKSQHSPSNPSDDNLHRNPIDEDLLRSANAGVGARKRVKNGARKRVRNYDKKGAKRTLVRKGSRTADKRRGRDRLRKTHLHKTWKSLQKGAYQTLISITADRNWGLAPKALAGANINGHP